jgi:hypothetical protein
MALAGDCASNMHIVEIFNASAANCLIEVFTLE